MKKRKNLKLYQKSNFLNEKILYFMIIHICKMYILAEMRKNLFLDKIFLIFNLKDFIF